MKHTRVVSTKCTPGFACRAFSDTTLVCFIFNEHTTKCSRYINTHVHKITKIANYKRTATNKSKPLPWRALIIMQVNPKHCNGYTGYMANNDCRQGAKIIRTFRWLNAILQYFQCVANGDTAVLHWAIDFIIYIWRMVFIKNRSHKCLEFTRP